MKVYITLYHLRLLSQYNNNIEQNTICNKYNNHFTLVNLHTYVRIYVCTCVPGRSYIDSRTQITAPFVPIVCP